MLCCNCFDKVSIQSWPFKFLLTYTSNVVMTQYPFLTICHVLGIVMSLVLLVSSGGYEDDESRDTRSRRRMTDDDDTVLDNASVTSQDAGMCCE